MRSTWPCLTLQSRRGRCVHAWALFLTWEMAPLLCAQAAGTPGMPPMGGGMGGASKPKPQYKIFVPQASSENGAQ